MNQNSLADGTPDAGFTVIPTGPYPHVFYRWVFRAPSTTDYYVGLRFGSSLAGDAFIHSLWLQDLTDE